jgi:hypothetical protein
MIRSEITWKVLVEFEYCNVYGMADSKEDENLAGFPQSTFLNAF